MAGMPMEPPTAFEMKLTPAFQLLHQARTQNIMVSDVVGSCIAKCMDTENLYSLRRAQMPIKMQLQLDQEEKKCLSFCTAKWEALVMRESQRLNQRGQAEHQYGMMEKMMQANGGMPPMM